MIMLKKIAYAALVSGLMFASLGASADDAFPEYNSIDYGVRIAGSELESVFPKDNSIDYGVRIAGSELESPFPRDNSNDYGITIAA
jgi:hypothetical protein